MCMFMCMHFNYYNIFYINNSRSSEPEQEAVSPPPLPHSLLSLANISQRGSPLKGKVMYLFNDI